MQTIQITVNDDKFEKMLNLLKLLKDDLIEDIKVKNLNDDFKNDKDLNNYLNSINEQLANDIWDNKEDEVWNEL